MSAKFIWAASGAGISEFAWDLAQRINAAWVGNDAAAHVTLLRATVAEEIAFVLEQQGVPQEQMFERVAQAANQWGIAAELWSDPACLSTGQTRRLAIAQALLGTPARLVLDCPFDGLDEPGAQLLAHALQNFRGDVTVCDRRWNPSAKYLDCYRLQGNLDTGWFLEPASPPIGDLEFRWPVSRERTEIDLLEKNKTLGNDCSVPEIIKATELVLKTGNFQLGPLDFSLRAGEVVRIAGPNGVGKTTLLLALAGLNGFESGKLHTVSCGWVPTHMDASFSQRSVLAEVQLGASLSHAQAVLEFLELESYAHLHPLDCSSSVRRLVALACGMVRGPAVLLLDEPTIGLDTAGLAQIGKALSRWLKGEYHGLLAARKLPALADKVKEFTAKSVITSTVKMQDKELERFETAEKNKKCEIYYRPAVIWTCHEAEIDTISERVYSI